ncbi:MAG: hypothetical protein FP825_03000 [Hyphomonas sp.]|uniref:hypothetical protein n=1 Tax=Hyphomonas sp. TaxID=87 RepID=UPI0017C274E8|nr:hypothetical protein [Hyphomonas sp.]MBA3067432.1 hypothetical protein [Hyphomonas sp.]MBU3920782.1 hypothetical protein [Alphaproteobacteria bacterium]MBU4061016.1 hypothetical protein [Alphaproteobacteria bacterium]
MMAPSMPSMRLSMRNPPRPPETGRIMSVRFALVPLLFALMQACTSTTYEDKPGEARVQGAMEQPFRDISWMRENPPDILIRAAETPYLWDPAATCEDFHAEILALDLILGPDLDQVPEEDEESSSDGAGLLSSAIGGLIGLPYRGIVRRISGAEKRERELRKAILAGMVRRAFLKGLARDAGCPGAELVLPDEIPPLIGSDNDPPPSPAAAGD